MTPPTAGATNAGTASPRRSYFTTQSFEYGGGPAITLASPITGRRYRFEHKGARVDIDPRDRAWLASQANVRQVG